MVTGSGEATQARVKLGRCRQQRWKRRWNGITYADEDTGYAVAKVDPRRGRDLVTVVGSLLGA